MNIKQIRSAFFVVLFLPLSLFAKQEVPKPTTSNDSKQISIRAGSVAPEGTPWAAWLTSVKDRIEKDGKGKIKLKVFLGGKLGGENEIVEGTKRGDVQLFGGSIGAVASKYVPELNVLELPFLFDSDEEADFVLDDLRSYVGNLLDQRGFVLSMWSENGWHGYATKGKCIFQPSDLKGLRMRSQESSIHLNTYKAFGATPVELPVPEVLSALEVGTVDGYSNTMIVTFALGWNKPITHFSYTKHIYQPAVIIYNKVWFNQLSKPVQKILLDRKEEKSGLAMIRSLEEPLKENLKAANVQFCEITKDQREKFKKQAMPVWDTFAKKGASSKEILAKVMEAKKKYANLNKKVITKG